MTNKVDPPIQTFRNCSNKYLRKEIELVPTWPIIAVGKEAHKVLSYLYPKRSILGVPHPTGGRGIHFNRLYNGKSHTIFKKTIQKQIADFKGKSGVEVWLKSTIKRRKSKNKNRN